MAGQMTTIEVDRNTAAILETLRAQAVARGVTLDALLKSLIEAEQGATNGQDEQPRKQTGHEAMLAGGPGAHSGAIEEDAGQRIHGRFSKDTPRRASGEDVRL